MGYRCPVCEELVADEEHLAHHVAVTGILGDEPHELFLDEHVDEWEQLGPTELGDVLKRHASETDHEPEPPAASNGSRGASRAAPQTPTTDSETVQSILEEAQAYTAEMYGLDDEDPGSAENE